jgi:hypothetical protein
MRHLGLAPVGYHAGDVLLCRTIEPKLRMFSGEEWAASNFCTPQDACGTRYMMQVFFATEPFLDHTGRRVIDGSSFFSQRRDKKKICPLDKKVAAVENI